MTAPAPLSWPQVIGTVERVLRGEAGAREELREELPAILAHPWLILGPEDVGDFAFFVALLREAGEDEAYEAALAEASQRIRRRSIPPEGNCATHLRLGVLFTEAGRHGGARDAFGKALARAGREAETAHALAGLAVVAARTDDWDGAVGYAHRARRLAPSVGNARERLDIRMRCCSVLFHAARSDGRTREAAKLVQELETVCDALIDSWGSEHPRALAALVTLASARHEIAAQEGDLTSAHRLTDVLAAASQRASTTLGARHPQARVVRETLERAEAASRRLAVRSTMPEARSAPQRPSLLEPLRHLAQPAELVVAGHHQGVPETGAGFGTGGPEAGPGSEVALHRVALELIVHGVVGTEPREMLGDPGVEQTQGDTTAGLYRRSGDVDAESRPEAYAGRPVPEAYSWSNLVTGSRTRVLWLILLPFTLINLAHWTRPATRRGGARRTVRLHGVCVRLLALSLTVVLVAGVCELALDVFAWQCAGTRVCARRHSWMDVLAPGENGAGGWLTGPGTRLVLAALVPAGLVGLLWRLGRRTWDAYESKPPMNIPGERDEGPGAPSLSLPGFWYSARLVSRLRAGHTAMGFLVVAGALTAAPAAHDRAGTDAVRGAVGWGLGVLIVAGAVWTVYVLAVRGRSEFRLDDRTEGWTVRGLPGFGLAVLALAAAYALWPRPGWVSSGRLPGAETFGVLAAVQGALITVLAVAGVWLYLRWPLPRTSLRGLASPAIAVLACVLTGTMAAGAVQGVTDWLTGRRGDLAGAAPELLRQVGFLPVLLALAALVQGVLLFQRRRTARRLERAVDGSYPEALPDRTRTRGIARAITRARFLDLAPWLVGLAAVALLLLDSAAVLNGYLSEGIPGEGAGLAHTTQSLGSWMIALGLVLFLNRGRIAYRDPSSRSAIGILWDVGTFWPRAAHPFAPPCYAERAVPDLTWRIATWTEMTGGRVLVSGHSQGSVLAAAAVWQLPPETRRRVALLTYGSPLERIYGRWFPAYFGPNALSALHREVAGWRNLWRLTDPVGGPVEPGMAATGTGAAGPARGRGAPGTGVPEAGVSGAGGSEAGGVPGSAGAGGVPGVDRGPLLDPLSYGRSLHHPLPRPVLGHGDYRSDPAFAEERRNLLARFVPARSADVSVPGNPPRRRAP
ncbi:hypothetical protein [Streptomyces iconiensis]|uniref:Integral membrane protein n=1 Tax=Streptomyces iconiensis TaxID=1384038 RepID=A0ABT7A6Y4_9ACTN|nr:hypothetical protein [Streptomyces iconiensis]MDJ1137100.1 hypothetical protein [Streptomyces iconiensis]